MYRTRKRNALWLAAICFLIAPLVTQAQLSSGGEVPGSEPSMTRVMQEGKGWKLLEIQDPENKRGEPGPEFWMVSEEGVENLPVSNFEKQQLQADFAADPPGTTSIIFVEKMVSQYEESGQLPPGYGQYVTQARLGESAESCFGWSTKIKNKDYTFSEFSNDWNFTLGSNVNGNFGVNIPLSGQAHLDFTYKIKKAFCVPYKFKFVSAHVNGNLTVNGDGDLSAAVTLSGSYSKEWKLFEPTLGSFTIWLGPVPVRIKITLPVHAGVALAWEATGTVGADADFGASGTFDYTCTKDGCSGSNSFTDSFDYDDLTASVEVDIDAELNARVMARVAIYDDSIAYVEAGLKGFVTGELWGYYGNTCGDANGDGQNETVRALAADLNWGYDIVYGIGGFLLPDREWESEGGRGWLGWWDLLGPGGSTALQPMFLGPSNLIEGEVGTYTVKMRPCYKYDHRVNLVMSPGGWQGNKFITAPKSTNSAENSTTLSRAWQTPGNRTVTVTNGTDGQGRDINVPYSRVISVGPACDTIRPTVAVTAPSAGEIISGSHTFFANASDNSAVTQVRFELNGSFLCSDTTAPYSCSANVNGFPTGDYSLRARAYDDCGNTQLSSPVTIRVVSNPEMNIDLPSAGSTVSGDNVLIKGWATDPNRVSSVTVTVDGQATLPVTYGTNRSDVCASVPVGDPNCPFVGFEASLNSELYDNGSHSISVTSTDTQGKSTTQTRSFVVNNQTTTPCQPGPNTLCLRNNRFKVEIQYVNGSGFGDAVAHPYGDQSGFFYFFSPDNLEVGVKVIGPANGYYWVYHGGATDREYTLAVTDTTSGTLKTYVKPQGSFCGGNDTQAFPAGGESAGPLGKDELASFSLPESFFEVGKTTEKTVTEATCTPTGTALCLQNDRFKVEVLRSGVAQPAIELTPDSGTFWFFQSTNQELLVKVLDGTGFNNHYWVFYGALTDRDYTIRVTDTSNGQVVNYTNPLGNYCGNGDTTAFDGP